MPDPNIAPPTPLDDPTVGPPGSRACCPRCGYEQRGVIESWRDRCPLEGTCAECGLELSWSAVLRPEFHEPRWCFEYAPRPRRLLPPPMRYTLLRSAWPWRFWRSVKMSDDLRPGRLALFVVLLVVAFILVAAVEQAAVAVRVRYVIEAQLAGPNMRSALTQQMQMLRQARAQVPAGAPWAANLDQQIATLQGLMSRPTPPLGHSYPAAIWEAIRDPWGRTSTGVITDPWRGNIMYPPPIELHDQALDRGGRRRDEPLRAYAFLAASASLALLVMLPGAFVLLPLSRRRAKVRWRHIVRIASYSLQIPALAAITVLLLVAAAAWWAPSRPALLGLATAVLLGQLLVMLLWWMAGIRSYLRMPHAISTTLALASVCLLLVLAGTWFVHPELALHAFDLIVPD